MSTEYVRALREQAEARRQEDQVEAEEHGREHSFKKRLVKSLTPVQEEAIRYHREDLVALLFGLLSTDCERRPRRVIPPQRCCRWLDVLLVAHHFPHLPALNRVTDNDEVTGLHCETKVRQGVAPVLHVSGVPHGKWTRG
jgi:hypothetical protein